MSKIKITRNRSANLEKERNKIKENKELIVTKRKEVEKNHA